jgi:hypothetical protein
MERLALGISNQCKCGLEGYAVLAGHVAAAVSMNGCSSAFKVNAPYHTALAVIAVPASRMATRPFCTPPDASTSTFSDLDTIFTPPASCGSPEYTESPWSQGYDTLLTTNSTPVAATRTVGSNIVIYTSMIIRNYAMRGRNPFCFPPNFPTSTCLFSDSEDSPMTHSEQNYIFSPGRCPEHYVTVDRSTDNAISDMTRAVCCPE